MIKSLQVLSGLLTFNTKTAITFTYFQIKYQHTVVQFNVIIHN